MIRESTSQPHPGAAPIPAWQGWLPWLPLTAVVIAWSFFGVAAKRQQGIAWPGLHNVIAIALYHDKPYAAIWSFQPLATGTAVLVTCVLISLLFSVYPRDFTSW